MAIEEKKFLGTAGVQQLITNVRLEIATAEQNAVSTADGNAAAKVQALANGQVATNTGHIGTMDNLETTNKADLVNAINEVRNAVSAGGTAAAITMTEQTTDLGDGVAKAYVLKQGDNTVGTINIPKDMVVQSGEVVVNPEGQTAGTYIKLTLANATNDIIYVNVGTLVDIYQAKASATQVQLAIDSSTREISASIVAGSITATELAANAVVTAKIADGNVTKTKLSTEVQASLDKADAAAQDAADKAAQALADAKEHAQGLIDEAEDQVSAMIGETTTEVFNDKPVWEVVDSLAMTLVEVAGFADQNGIEITSIKQSLAEGGATANAIADAKKAGTDASTAVTTLENGKVATLRTDVDNLMSVSYVEITAGEIDAMFTPAN